jgi:PPM family protein phosphatase
MFSHIESYAISDIGLYRSNNEDVCAQLADENFFILADGIAGLPAGEIAAKEAVLHVCDDVERFLRQSSAPSTKTVKEFLKKSLLSANKWIRSLSTQYCHFSKMGTTICAILIIDKNLFCIHVGDSRIYRFREKLEKLTTDHSTQEQSNSQKIPPHSKNKTILTRAVGISPYLEPEISITSFLPGDTVFLSSDGLHGALSDAEMEAILKKNLSPEKASIKLIEAAKKAESHDNITIVMIKHTG